MKELQVTTFSKHVTNAHCKTDVTPLRLLGYLHSGEDKSAGLGTRAVAKIIFAS